jgi:predicted dehydrogenase
MRRRAFLEQFGVSTAAVLAAGYTATAGGYAANETLNVGCIGTGGRCRHLMQALAQIEGVRITAVCDVWEDHLMAGKKLADPNAATTHEYEELLERSDVDAVIIGTPDHWHVPLTAAACEASKDVYVEKPLTHNLEEGPRAIEAQNRHQRIVQVGHQQRSMPQFLKAKEIVASGAIGPVRKVHLTWNRNSPRFRKTPLGISPTSVEWKRFLGNAPDQPFDEYRFRNWRWFWDFGGGLLTDLMVHQIDIANWFLELGHPQSAVTIGDHFQAKDVWETPDTIQTLIRYPEQEAQVYFEGTFFNARNGAMLEFMGSEATLYVDRGRYEVIPERNKRIQPEELILGSGPKGADFFDAPNGEVLHLSNWVECIRSRRKPNAPADAGVAAVEGAHLGNRAYRTGQTAVWG